MKTENKLWVALTGLNDMKTGSLNKLIIDIYVNKKSNVPEFFKLDEEGYRDKYSFSSEQIENINLLKDKLPEYEKLYNEIERNSINVIPINSKDYSRQLKENLKINRSPSVIYVKGDVSLLNQPSVAIVGSRSASELSLKFTDSIAKKLSESGKVIVSGYAKGVDRQALDSALKYHGKSIIVLPQGILTFIQGMKNYQNEIDKGNLMVLSTYFPKLPWSVQLAMGRNSIIYGLAEVIYVAESNNSGGTWSGVLEGLKRNQKIFVRKPIMNENNANNELIERGATPLIWEHESEFIPAENSASQVSDNAKRSIEQMILKSLFDRPKSSRELKDSLKIDWSVNKITSFLKNHKDISTLKSKPLKFVKKSLQSEKTLFE